MNGPEPVDLSPLNPNADRWKAVVEATLRRVDGVLAARPRHPLDLIASWSRRLLVGAGVLALLLVPAEAALDHRELRAEQMEVLVGLSTRSAHGEPPTGEELWRVVGRGVQP